MDAGCLQEFSRTQSVDAGTKQTRRDFVHTVNLWYERSRQRRELRELASESHWLEDVGLSNYDVLREARKPFWQK